MTTAVATRPTMDPNRPAPDPATFRRFLEGNSVVLKRVAPNLDPSRAIGIVCSAASRNPYLQKCTPLSILRVLQDGATLGLEVAGPLQELHAVPYYNNDLKVYEAQSQPGYQGLVKLVLQTGSVARVTCEPVYKGDAFDYQLGDAPFLRHKPDLTMLGEERPDDEIVAFYAVAFYKDGTTQFEVMGRAAVEKIKARALEKKRGAKGPWETDYAEMGRKTVLRRLCKRLPKTSALARALDLQAAAEGGEHIPVEPMPVVVEGAHMVVDPAPAPAAAAPEAPVPPPVQTPSGEVAPSADYHYGPALSAAQVNTAKGHADRLKLHHDSSRRVIAAVSISDKASSRAFMDQLFSKDDAKIRAAFESHEAWGNPLQQTSSQDGMAVPPGDDPGWPEE